MTGVKKELLIICKKMIDVQVEELKKSILSARESAKNDTKSSMGDKYETSREMLQQEINLLEKQLSEGMLKQFQYNQINFEKISKTIIPGSLIRTNLGLFLLAVNIGEIELHQEKIKVISSASPLGQLLRDKKIGDKVFINGKEILILEVW